MLRYFLEFLLRNHSEVVPLYVESSSKGCAGERCPLLQQIRLSAMLQTSQDLFRLKQVPNSTFEKSMLSKCS